MTLDGGRNALAGYLYQLISTTAVAVRKVIEDDKGISGLIISHEFHGQDAAIRQSNSTSLIQFKYSGSVGELISARDILEMLDSFDVSREALAQAGTNVASYLIRTNKQLDPSANDLNSKRHGSAIPNEFYLDTKLKNGKPHKGNLALLERHSSKPDVAARAWFEILKKTTIEPGFPLDVEVHDLRNFSHMYGVTEEEFQSRVNSLIGHLVIETSAKGKECNIDTDWLRRFLIGSPHALPLTFGSNSILKKSQETMEKRLQAQLPKSLKLVHRERLATQVRWELSQHPVVLLVGEGGCGKSILALQLMLERGKSHLCFSIRADEASQDELIASFHRYRCEDQKLESPRTIDEIVRRLALANPEVTPLITLDVDGVDEPAVPGVELRRLTRFCVNQGNEGKVKLVISCRSLGGDITETVSRYAQPLLDSPYPNLSQIGSVLVDDFDDTEFREAVGRLDERVMATLRPILSSSSFDDYSVMESAPDAVVVSRPIIDSLRHPVVWGTFAGLETSQQLSVLSGGEATHILASQLFMRFSSKVRYKSNSLKSAALVEAFAVVAKVSESSAGPFGKTDWDQMLQIVGKDDSAILFNESLTYGLIKRESVVTWRWRHEFLVNWLINN